MPSFLQLVREHRPLLLLDTASSRIQAGLCLGPGQSRWETREEGAGTGLFRCLEALGADPNEMAAFAFCEGPGSVLGVRIAAMALRTWVALRPRPVFGYFSLALVAHGCGRPGAAVADARRGLWHRYEAGGKLERVAPETLAPPLLLPEGFRHWSAPPAGAEPVPYDVPALLGRAGDAALFRPLENPDAFLHEEPRYATWSPRAHGQAAERQP